jgi:hypothetical protein
MPLFIWKETRVDMEFDERYDALPEVLQRLVQILRLIPQSVQQVTMRRLEPGEDDALIHQRGEHGLEPPQIRLGGPELAFQLKASVEKAGFGVLGGDVVQPPHRLLAPPGEPFVAAQREGQGPVGHLGRERGRRKAKIPDRVHDPSRKIGQVGGECQEEVRPQQEEQAAASDVPAVRSKARQPDEHENEGWQELDARIALLHEQRPEDVRRDTEHPGNLADLTGSGAGDVKPLAFAVRQAPEEVVPGHRHR